MRVNDHLTAYKKSVRARTLNVLNQIPRDKMNWKPTDSSLSLGQLVRHLAQAEMAWQELIKGRWDARQFLEMRKGLDLVEATGEVSSLEAELTSLKVAHHETLELIASLSEEDLARTFNGLKGKVTVCEVILGLCEHEAHHRGQIVAYLRLLGVDHPSPWKF